MLLQHGDRVVFLGDFITAQRLYTTYVQSYLQGRYPQLNLSFVNAGLDGDTVVRGLARLARDVLALRPTLVVVLYGLSDGAFATVDRAPVAAFATDLRVMVQAIQSTGARVLLLSTPPVDQERAEFLRLLQYNQTLRALADAVLRLGAEMGVPAYDLHSLMQGVQMKARAASSGFAMSQDGVHPDAKGHLVIAYGVLSALGVPRSTSSITIDAAAGTIACSGGVAGGVLQREGKTLSIQAEFLDLPFYVEVPAQGILPFLPFQHDFNHILLRIRNLRGDAFQIRTRHGRSLVTASQCAIGLDAGHLSVTGPLQRAAALQRFVQIQTGVYHQVWREIAFATGDYDPVPHRLIIEASMRLDRSCAGLSGAQERRLELSIIPSGSDEDLILAGEFLRSWHLAGPFPGRFSIDHLDGEARFSQDQELPRSLQVVIEPLMHADCLGMLVGQASNSVAYAQAVIASPIEQEATLALGSDDGIAVWLNGELLLSRLDIARGHAPDQEHVRVRLLSGRNRLLLKVSQYAGMWGFSARFTSLVRPVRAS